MAASPMRLMSKITSYAVRVLAHIVVHGEGKPRR
jgi:hypothetical protein